MEYFWILTLQSRTVDGQVMSNTIEGMSNVPAPTTRKVLFREALAEAKRVWAETTPIIGPVAVLFFSIEPNEVTS